MKNKANVLRWMACGLVLSAVALLTGCVDAAREGLTGGLSAGISNAIIEAFARVFQ